MLHSQYQRWTLMKYNGSLQNPRLIKKLSVLTLKNGLNVFSLNILRSQIFFMYLEKLWKYVFHF